MVIAQSSVRPSAVAAKNEASLQEQSPNSTAQPVSQFRPIVRSAPTEAAARRSPGINARSTWSMPPFDASPRGTPVCTYDNGSPLDDFGDPASQWSENAEIPVWNFIGAAADDFMLGNPGDTDLCRITMIRAAFFIADDGSGTPTPTNTWKTVFVTIYPNDDSGPDDVPGGLPDNLGGQTGDYTISQQVHVSALLNETLVGECRPCYQIDIPVNFLVRKGVKYWLSIVPRHAGPPNQSFWCTSSMWSPMQDGSKQYFPSAGPPYNNWTDFEGNFGFCPSVPPAGTNRNLSFQILTAASEPDRIGACCEESGSCADSASIVDCQRPAQRFAQSTLCMNLIPPCGVNDPGACCLPSGTCQDGMTPAQCAQAGGQWFDELCANLTCPPTNEDCADQLALSGNNLSVIFNTNGTAMGDGLPMTNCGSIVHDLWFSYEAPCDGVVAIDTIGSAFDTVLAVYGPSASCPVTCPTSSGSETTCNDNIPNGTTSSVVVAATVGQCILIRVGGQSASAQNSGPGVLNIQCIDDGLGACCHGNLTCDLLPQVACTAPGDQFFPGESCATACRAPDNDDCEDAFNLVGDPVAFHFNTTNAITEAGAPQTTCGQLFKDVWFSYEVPCDGTIAIRTIGSSFDTLLAVYGPASECPVACPAPAPDGNVSEWACNDDIGGMSDSYVLLPAVMGQCILIRVGGKSDNAAGGGDGVLSIDCIPEGNGACCHVDLSCDVTESTDCDLPTDLFTPGQPCLADINCPPACCVGDMNDDCRVDFSDVSLFAAALLDPSGLDPGERCRADINRDMSIDALDIAPFVIRLLSMTPCVVCCPGDTNGDGVLDALDLQGLILTLLDPPHCTTLAYCRADVNGDLVLDLADVESMVQKLLAGVSCP